MVVGRALVPDARGALCLTDPLELRVRAGRIAAIVPAGERARAPASIGERDTVLLPALADSHLHLVATAAARAGADLSSGHPRSLGELRDRIANAAAGVEAEEWVRIGGFEPFWL